MEMTPGSAPAAKRAKSKVIVKPAADEAPAAKKSRAPRKKLTTQTTAPESAAVAEPSGEDLGGMIATAAYYLAAARNFSPGHELDDWLEAERTVRAKLYG